MSDIRDVLQASFDRREEAWSQWGTVDGDVLSHLINPHFMGGPRWPALRQAFRVVRSPRGILVASDGLSDPFDSGEGPEDVNGFGLECYALSADPIERVPGSWLFDLVWQMSQFAAQHGDLAALLDDLGVITTELYDVHIPEEHRSQLVNPEGRVGVICGVGEPPIPPGVDGPLSRIRLASVTLLTLSELTYAIERGDSGRRELRTWLGTASSSLRRTAVV